MARSGGADLHGAAASRIMQATVAAKASRQVATAVAAALFRCLVSAEGGDEVESELAARWAEMKPCMKEQVIAGSAGRPLQASGEVRARRNVAVHCDLGAGADVVGANGTNASRRQRGGRRRLATQVGSDDSTSLASNGSTAEVPSDDACDGLAATVGECAKEAPLAAAVGSGHVIRRRFGRPSGAACAEAQGDDQRDGPVAFGSVGPLDVGVNVQTGFVKDVSDVDPTGVVAGISECRPRDEGSHSLLPCTVAVAAAADLLEKNGSGSSGHGYDFADKYPLAGSILMK